LHLFTRSAVDSSLARSIKHIFGFRPGNIHLYKLAFLHKSVGQDTIKGLRVNNERLEFLGDAILDAVVADFLFKTFPARDEGFLTEMRSKIVSRAQLNKLSMKLGLDHLIQLDQGNGMARSVRGDAFEALIGAVYLDKGYRFTRKFLLNRIIRPYFDLSVLETQEYNYKSRVIEWAQREKMNLQFSQVGEIGSGSRKQYLVEVVINGVSYAKAQHYSIKGAEQLAAEKAWMKISPDPVD